MQWLNEGRLFNCASRCTAMLSSFSFWGRAYEWAQRCHRWPLPQGHVSYQPSFPAPHMHGVPRTEAPGKMWALPPGSQQACHVNVNVPKLLSRHLAVPSPTSWAHRGTLCWALGCREMLGQSHSVPRASLLLLAYSSWSPRFTRPQPIAVSSRRGNARLSPQPSSAALCSSLLWGHYDGHPPPPSLPTRHGDWGRVGLKTASTARSGPGRRRGWWPTLPSANGGSLGPLSPMARRHLVWMNNYFDKWLINYDQGNKDCACYYYRWQISFAATLIATWHSVKNAQGWHEEHAE